MRFCFCFGLGPWVQPRIWGKYECIFGDYRLCGSLLSRIFLFKFHVLWQPQMLTSPPYCDFWGASKCLIPQLSHNLSRKANKCGLCPKVLNPFQFLPAFRYSVAFNELFLNFVQNLFRHYWNSKNVFSSHFIMFSVSVENISLLDFLGILSHHLQLNIIHSTFLILIPILLSHLTV